VSVLLLQHSGDVPIIYCVCVASTAQCRCAYKNQYVTVVLQILRKLVNSDDHEGILSLHAYETYVQRNMMPVHCTISEIHFRNSVSLMPHYLSQINLLHYSHVHISISEVVR